MTPATSAAVTTSRAFTPTPYLYHPVLHRQTSRVLKQPSRMLRIRRRVAPASDSRAILLQPGIWLTEANSVRSTLTHATLPHAIEWHGAQSQPSRTS